MSADKSLFEVDSGSAGEEVIYETLETRRSSRRGRQEELYSTLEDITAQLQRKAARRLRRVPPLIKMRPTPTIRHDFTRH